MNNDLQKIVDEIQERMAHLADAGWDKRTFADFLELLEDGEDWVLRMRKFLGGPT